MRIRKSVVKERLHGESRTSEDESLATLQPRGELIAPIVYSSFSELSENVLLLRNSDSEEPQNHFRDFGSSHALQ